MYQLRLTTLFVSAFLFFNTSPNFEKSNTRKGVMWNLEEDKIYDVTEVAPGFKGGVNELFKYLGSNIKYPKEAKKAKKEGIVYLKFVVEKDGSLSNITVTKGIGYGMDEEAKRVVESMPAWNPGLINKRPERCYYQIPISYKLK